MELFILEGAMNEGGVASFNGRSGAVVPSSGDYTPTLVGAEVAGAAAGVMATHEADLDPHPNYLTQTEGDQRYALIGASNGSNGTVYAATWETKSLTGQQLGWSSLVSSNLQSLSFDGTTFTALAAGWLNMVAVVLMGNPGGTMQVLVGGAPGATVSGNNTDAIKTFSAAPGAWVTVDVRWFLAAGEKLRLVYDGALGPGYPAERMRVQWAPQ